MSAQLHDRLHDLVADAPPYVVPDARGAWAAGARRRTRHRVAVTATAAVVLALLAGAVSWVPRPTEPAPAHRDGSGVTSYPTRVAKPWFGRDLPARPGPLAGLVDTETGQLYAVSGTGRAWRVNSSGFGGVEPALSADGSMLASWSDGRLVLRDLRTGISHVADGVSDGGYTREQGGPSGDYWVSMQSPMMWSPSGDRVLVVGERATGDDVRALVIASDGSVQSVPGPRVARPAWPAGWTAAGEIVWVSGPFDRPGSDAATVVTSMTGDVVRRIGLDVPPDIQMAGQDAGSVSPDGTRVLLQFRQGATDRALLVSLVTGAVIDEVDVEFPSCPPSWKGNRPHPSFPGSDQVAVRHDDGSAQIMVDPAFHATCAVWASDALAGRAHRGVSGWLFGDSIQWFAWRWRELGLGVGLLGVGALLAWRRRRRDPSDGRLDGAGAAI